MSRLKTDGSGTVCPKCGGRQFQKARLDFQAVCMTCGETLKFARRPDVVAQNRATEQAKAAEESRARDAVIREGVEEAARGQRRQVAAPVSPTQMPPPPGTGNLSPKAEAKSNPLIRWPGPDPSRDGLLRDALPADEEIRVPLLNWQTPPDAAAFPRVAVTKVTPVALLATDAAIYMIKGRIGPGANAIKWTRFPLEEVAAVSVGRGLRVKRKAFSTFAKETERVFVLELWPVNGARRSFESEYLEAGDQAELISALLAEAPILDSGDGADESPQSSTALPLSEELQRIATLHQAGVLTDEEFAAAKARLLAG